MRANATVRSAFRRYAVAEESMLRAVMPRVSVDDPSPLESPARIVVTIANRGASRLVRVVPVLTYTLSEVANA